MDCPIEDRRVESISPLVTPHNFITQFPNDFKNRIRDWRQTIVNILDKKDPRLLVVVGPCSIHDENIAYDYANRLSKVKEKYPNLFIVMRVYFEKPRTTVGWKGLIYDPYLDGTNRIDHGLKIARRILYNINRIGVPCGCEFLDTIIPQYVSDLVSWGAIGARTTESQIHRQLVSACSMPIGFKNGTGGTISMAVDALRSASISHCFLGIDKHGQGSIVTTKGNTDTHIILRGGKEPNYEEKHIAHTLSLLEKNNYPQRVMVDCSHGNSRKQHHRQVIVAQSIAEQRKTNKNIVGVMIESNIHEGKQALIDPSTLKYGVSITDACLSWEDTLKVLELLN